MAPTPDLPEKEEWKMRYMKRKWTEERMQELKKLFHPDKIGYLVTHFRMPEQEVVKMALKLKLYDCFKSKEERYKNAGRKPLSADEKLASKDRTKQKEKEKSALRKRKKEELKKEKEELQEYVRKPFTPHFDSSNDRIVRIGKAVITLRPGVDRKQFVERYNRI